MDDSNQFSIQERIACCFWFDQSRSTDLVQEKFQQRFHNNHGKKSSTTTTTTKPLPLPSRQSIRLWYQRFIKTGCLIHDDNGNLDQQIDSMANHNDGNLTDSIDDEDSFIKMNNCNHHQHSNGNDSNVVEKNSNGAEAVKLSDKMVKRKIGRPRKKLHHKTILKSKRSTTTAKNQQQPAKPTTNSRLRSTK